MGAAIVKDEMFVAYNRTPGGQLFSTDARMKILCP
jgi:hypothetical protein